MISLKFVFLFVFAFGIAGLSEAGSRIPREVETPQENSQLDKVQEQLMTAFDSVKKSMEELASKFNTEDIIQGVQNLTSKLESYVKQTADQFSSTASGMANSEPKKEESV